MFVEVRKALYTALNNAGIVDDDANVLPIFFPNRSTDTKKNKKPADKHLRADLLPIDHISSLFQISIYMPADNKDFESARVAKQIKDNFDLGATFTDGGLEFKAVTHIQPESAPYKKGGFWIDPMTVRIKHKVCA